MIGIKSNIVSYKTMEELMKIYVQHFGNHESLVVLRHPCTKTSSLIGLLLYVHIFVLKKYVVKIPSIMRAHHKDIVSRHKGFLGKVKCIGNGTCSLGRWL
jgi:hypothetical protein